MKIYLVTVNDPEAEEAIGKAIEISQYLFIGPWGKQYSIQEIEEYVNVSD